MHQQSEIISHTHSHHIASLRMLVAVFVALLGLTAITVELAHVDFGDYSFIVAMLVATIKASLVALFFMGLKWDSGFNRLAFLASFIFVWLFIAFTMIDTREYLPSIDWKEHVQAEKSAANP